MNKTSVFLYLIEKTFLTLLNLYKKRHQIPYLVAFDIVFLAMYTCLNF